MWKPLIRLCACASVLALLSGCGGGSGTAQTPQNTDERITSANQANFSTDAIVLAERAADGPWLSAGMAAMFDADLARIRKAYSQVAGIHAREDYGRSELLVGLHPTAPWTQMWMTGHIPTGVASVDSVTSTYGATTVQYMSLMSYSLKFNAPLNMRAVASLLKASSSEIAYAEPDGSLGDGDNISFEQAGGQKKYNLSHGWGDCIGGCISHHVWTFTFADGTITLQESGPPIPADGGRP